MKPKFKVGDRVRHVVGGAMGVILKIIEYSECGETRYKVRILDPTDRIVKQGDLYEVELEKQPKPKKAPK